jgi:hypothetical protein
MPLYLRAKQSGALHTSFGTYSEMMQQALWVVRGSWVCCRRGAIFTIYNFISTKLGCGMWGTSGGGVLIVLSLGAERIRDATVSLSRQMFWPAGLGDAHHRVHFQHLRLPVGCFG